MAIKDGELIQADEIMNLAGANFADTAQLIFNAQYIGFHSKLDGDGSPNLDKVAYSAFDSDSMVITGNMEYDSANDYYWGPTSINESEYITYDEMNDSSVDTSKWTVLVDSSGGSASVTENTSVMILSESHDTGTPSAQITSKDDLWDSGNGAMFRINSMSKTGVAIDNYYIYVGGVIILSGSATKTNYKIQVVKILDALKYRTNDDNAGWSSWTNTIQGNTSISFRVYGYPSSNYYAGSCSMQIDYCRLNTFSTSMGSTTDYITSGPAPSADVITNAIPIVNYTPSGDSSVFIQLSANGTDYEDSSNKQAHRFTSTGTSLKTRILNKGLNAITEYASKWGLY